MKIKLKNKKIFSYLNFMVFLISAVALFYFGVFFKSKVLRPINTTADGLTEKINTYYYDINIDEFNKVIGNIEEKKNINNLNIENFFN